MKPLEKTKNVIVIGGKMYAGKSTIGTSIQQQSDYKWVFSPMAKLLKELVNGYHGLTWDEALAVKEQIRPDYQRFGTEAVRNNFADDFWAVMALRNPSDFLIMDDVRFPNEREVVLKHAKTVTHIWVDTREETRKARCEYLYGLGSYKNTDHASEKGFTGFESFWDHIVENNFTSYADLVAEVSEIVDQVDMNLRQKGIMKHDKK